MKTLKGITPTGKIVLNEYLAQYNIKIIMPNPN